MIEKNPTTVRLTENAQKIKNQWAGTLGLKEILSVGLELFDALSDLEKLKKVKELAQREKRVEKWADEVVSGAEADAAKLRQKARQKPVKAG